MTVTVPDGTTTPGVVSAVGTVAATSGSGPGTTTTIPLYVTLVHPSAAGTLDQAPVKVSITTATAHNALAVPVGALLAQAPSGYDVEVAGPGITRRYVPVTTGVFDDTEGLIKVLGLRRRPGFAVGGRGSARHRRMLLDTPGRHRANHRTWC